MVDECTDVTTVEELFLFCRWIENGEPTEHFIDLLPMKRTDTESIYSALVECLKGKNIQLSNLIGMGFDGAATFSGKKPVTLACCAFIIALRNIALAGHLDTRRNI